MLRGILRNVQYLFLFFSVLLVFLALERLQYLPQHNTALGGSAAEVADFDKPSSEELKSFYYRGDETKEIGLRSFRVGAFKFFLPSFSASSSSYRPQREHNKNMETNYLAVPPPNDRPKSVAYILDTSIIATAKSLTKSIQRMHAGSKYGYKMYALTKSKEFLALSGIEIIDSTVYREGVDTIGESHSRLTGSKQIYKIWRRHEIIINLSGIETLDGLFDILLSTNSNRKFSGVDSFLLKPHHSYTRGREEILIFNGSSHRAFETCLKFLSCLTDRTLPNDSSANKEIEEESKEGSVSRLCIDQIDSNNHELAMCTYHEDFIDCSESMLAKDTT